MKDFEEEIVDNDEILNIVNELTMLNTEVKYKNDSFKDLKKDYPDKVKILEESFLIYMGENDLKLLKKELQDKWKQFT